NYYELTPELINDHVSIAKYYDCWMRYCYRKPCYYNKMSIDKISYDNVINIDITKPLSKINIKEHFWYNTKNEDAFRIEGDYHTMKYDNVVRYVPIRPGS